MNGGPGINWGAQRDEQFPHLENYTLTPAQPDNLSVRHNTENKHEFYLYSRELLCNETG